MTKQELERKIAVLFGGRVAEKIFFNHFSTGASDDLARITDIARSMLTRYGMDENIGHIVYEDNRQNHLGQNMSGHSGEAPMSDKTAEQIDSAIKSIVDTIYSQTSDLLEKNREVVDYSAYWEIWIVKEYKTLFNTHELQETPVVGKYLICSRFNS